MPSWWANWDSSSNTSVSTGTGQGVLGGQGEGIWNKERVGEGRVAVWRGKGRGKGRDWVLGSEWVEGGSFNVRYGESRVRASERESLHFKGKT